MKARLFFTIFVTAAWTLYAAAAAEDPSLKVSIAVPYFHGKRSVGMPGSHFHVIITNASQTRQKIWSEGCQGGWDILSFELTDDTGRRMWKATKEPKAWLSNYPEFLELEPGDSLVLNVEYGKSAVWKGFPRLKNPYGPDSKGFTMRAVLEAKPNRLAEELGVWTGRAVSKPDLYFFPGE
jgi:hypothetical protein